MPIYEYNCRKCSTHFEKLVRTMSASDEKIACPECGSDQTQRALSVVAPISADGASKSSDGPPPGMCGRCGVPGPCGS